MPKLNYVAKAQKDIYTNGKEVKYVSQKGKKKGETLTKRDRTQPENNKDEILIHKGEPYYWYQFQFRDKIITKTKPSRSALTGSAYLSQVYDLQDNFHQSGTLPDLQDQVEDVKSTLEDMKSELEEKLENIPEQLREANAGTIIQERIDQLDSAISELEGIDFDEDEGDADDSEDKNDSEEEAKGEKNEGTLDEPYRWENKLEEKYGEASDALGNL